MIVIPRRQRLLDGLAIGASALCLIHCLLLPALIVLIPAVAGFLTLPEEFHVAALAFAVPTSLVALLFGYRRHRRLDPALIALAGLAFLALGVLAASEEWIETALTVPGAVLLAIGHALNWRALRHGASAGSDPAGQHAQ